MVGRHIVQSKPLILSTIGIQSYLVIDSNVQDIPITYNEFIPP